MNWKSELLNVIDQLADNPKVVALASGFSSGAGVLTVAQLLTGLAGGLAVFAGLACTLVLIRLNLLKIRNEEIQNRMLRQKAADSGVELED